ncbi:MAG: hotdog domain-containing protein [Myxococcota bacterium]
MIDEIPLALPRHATSPRQVARPAAVWRLLQDAALTASTQRGWPPARYRNSGVALVLARMIVIHHQELRHYQSPRAHTWVHAFHRRTLTDRELRLHSDVGLVASAHQRWAHVSIEDEQMSIVPASDDLIGDFSVHQTAEPATRMPRFNAAQGPKHRFGFRCWYTWLDPLNHVNHPTYLQWCDEAVMQQLAKRGIPPQQLQPIADQVQYRTPVLGDDPVEVVFDRIGEDGEGGVSIRCVIRNPETEAIYARATLMRRLADGAPLAPLLD